MCPNDDAKNVETRKGLRGQHDPTRTATRSRFGAGGRLKYRNHRLFFGRYTAARKGLSCFPLTHSLID